MAPTTDQLVALFGYDPNVHYAQLRAQGVPDRVIQDVMNQNNARIAQAFPTNAVATPSGTAITPTAGTRTPTQPFVTTGTGQINVPYGSDYLNPTLQLYATMLGLASNEKTFGQGLAEDRRQFDLGFGENQRQFNLTFPETQRQFNESLGFDREALRTNTLLNAAQALAGLYAAGPQSAAELAFLQAGMGFPAIGGSQAAAEDLFGAATRGASGRSTFSAGGQSVGIPNTLSGGQMRQLQGNPNLAGVIQSYARAAGNPDIFARSQAALVPSGYRDIMGGL